MKEAIKKLENKGYYIENMFDGFYGTLEDQYELQDESGKTVMTYLSKSQVISLANIL